MLRLRLGDLLLLTAGIVTAAGAPIGIDEGNKTPGVQNISVPQPTVNGSSLPAQQTKTAVTAMISQSTPGPKSPPSETFIKTVLKGFFDDLKNRPRLVDNLLKHGSYKDILSDPLAMVEKVQFKEDPHASSQQVKDQPEVRPLVAPVLTLVPVLLTPGNSGEENQNQGILVPVQQPPLVSRTPTAQKTNLNSPGYIDSKGLKSYQTVQRKDQQPQKMQNGKSNHGLLQAQGQLILRAYELPQVPKPQSQEVKQGDEEKPVEDPYYIYSIIPVVDEPGVPVGNLETEVDSSSSSTSGGCSDCSDAVSQTIEDEDAADIIYDEAPAFYYYVYYDDDGAAEAEKKIPPLQHSEVPALPASGEKIIDLSKAVEIAPKGINNQASAADASGVKLSDKLSNPVDSTAEAVSGQRKEGFSKTDAGKGSNVKRKAEKVEDASEEDLKNLHP